MQTLLRAEKFLGRTILDSTDEAAFEEISISMEELEHVELEKEKFTNLRRQTDMLMQIIDSNTVIQYPSVTRTKFEVRNGYQEAVRRGANLGETEVFNLLFRFRGHLRGDGIALMCRGRQGEEWIMLCPDDTKTRIQLEVDMYRNVATKLTLQGRMNSDDQNALLENLKMIDVGVRCANTLQHEYGHVIQHRIWDQQGIKPHDYIALYEWFVETGYVRNVSFRFPNFEVKTDLEKIHILKESFVEDYRIGLNLSYRKGIFELQNSYCFRGDFQNPELMFEGVSIVKSVVKRTGVPSGKPTFFEDTFEPDRIALTKQIMAESLDFDVRNVKPMTEEDHQAVLRRLKALQESKELDMK